MPNSAFALHTDEVTVQKFLRIIFVGDRSDNNGIVNAYPLALRTPTLSGKIITEKLTTHPCLQVCVGVFRIICTGRQALRTVQGLPY